MKVLVTGHKGYIGTVLVPLLLDAGHHVVGLDSDLYSTCTFGDNIDGIPKIHEVPEIVKDVRDVTAYDVEGFDALAKVTILANVVMGGYLKPDQIPCKGISHITLDDIEAAKANNKRWKLIGEINKDNGGVKASVAPVMIDFSHPLAGVNGATNAITFTTDLMGAVTIVGAGAGKIETGFSILADILEIHRKL